MRDIQVVELRSLTGGNEKMRYLFPWWLFPAGRS
jgi:hypothetical protein